MQFESCDISENNSKTATSCGDKLKIGASANLCATKSEREGDREEGNLVGNSDSLKIIEDQKGGGEGGSRNRT
jgi:hypothetical protein